MVKHPRSYTERFANPPENDSNGDARTFEASLKRLNGDAGTSALGKCKPAAKQGPSPLSRQL
jgi:hypothetical protein